VEIVDQSEVPGIGCVDFLNRSAPHPSLSPMVTYVIGSHLHPLFEIGQNWHALHGGNGAAAHPHAFIIVVCWGSRSAAQGLSFSDGSGRSLDLVHLDFMKGLTVVHAFCLLLSVIVERNSGKVWVRDEAAERGWGTYFMGDLPGVATAAKSLARGMVEFFR
jgi:hypothetical protein